MTCCVPAARGANSGLPDSAAIIVRESAPPIGPESVCFAAAKTFVGTDAPLIKGDGEGPRRAVSLPAFALEPFSVTNARFAAFIEATGYVTEAENFGWSPVFQALLPAGHEYLKSAGATPWWVKVDGACWNAPEGPGTGIDKRPDHPVVQVSWHDARAFAKWAGGRLPSEAEWEHAARGGLDDPRFPWGGAEPTDKDVYCNIWQGTFPHDNTQADGYLGTSPVDAFKANGLGLYGMAGNVWEWTADPFKVRSVSIEARRRNATARAERHKVLKGGSFLCHRSYCYRYRIAARSGLPPDSAASNAGFRVAYDLPDI